MLCSYLVCFKISISLYNPTVMFCEVVKCTIYSGWWYFPSVIVCEDWGSLLSNIKDMYKICLWRIPFPVGRKEG